MNPARPVVDLGASRRIHIVGVGGAGMSAIATVLVEMGHRVSGSDAVASSTLDGLGAIGVDAALGHYPANLAEDVDFVAVSTAIASDNPEVAEARRRGVPVLRRAELLAAICAERETIAVSGTHGKTTTSSLLAEVLRGLGRDVGYLVGAKIASLGGAAAWGSDALFVVEADESDGSAFELPRHAAVLTNVEPDHLEHHGDFRALVGSFADFIDSTPGPVVLCVDDPLLAGWARPDRWTYGSTDRARVVVADVAPEPLGISWEVRIDGEALGRARLARPGVHNALNATAAIAMAAAMGEDPVAAIEAVSAHRGVARRFEPRGRARGVTFVDDYAHLPTEVAAALAAAAGGGWKRVVAVFQPHRYSRTEALGAEFADSFDDADVLVVTDVYSAGEPPRPGVSGHSVLDPVLSAHPGRRAHHVANLDELEELLDGLLRPGDLCLTLGAGDLTTMPTRLVGRWGGT
ncbi:MAG: UDP-N-acetylmuramate--L-alanine ligase [Microthrixaceae bacterium]|nr:UDP-N-acetylmuramate--L-alanine ligase [Microthrixaceae bacterium]